MARRQRGSSPTLSDVARHAGVSLATASRAINGTSTRTVGEDLAERFSGMLAFGTAGLRVLSRPEAGRPS